MLLLTVHQLLDLDWYRLVKVLISDLLFDFCITVNMFQ